MRALFIVLALASAIAWGSADVYRWTDADGQVHYTDRPRPGAERITITVTPPASGSAGGSGVSPSAQEPEPADESPAPVGRYQSLTITSPTQEQVLWNIEGQLDVAAAVQPPLQPGHALQFNLDGRTELAEPESMGAQFQEVFRGEHSLQVEVVDAEGRTLVASPTTRFYVRQNALPNPIPTPLPTPRPRP